jgi:signal transduction histidine kinase
MIGGIFTNGPLYWLRAPKSIVDSHNDEYLVAFTRLGVSVCCLAVNIHAHNNALLKLCVVLSFSYLVYSLCIVLMLHFFFRTTALVQIVIHCVDIVLVLHMAILFRWPAMSLFLFLFVLAGAAIRWGFWETQLTAGAFLILLIPGSLLYHLDLSPLWHQTSPLELFPELLLCLGVLLSLGLLAEASAASSQRSWTDALLASIPTDCGFERALRNVWAKRFELFGFTQVLIVSDEHERNRAFLFRINNSLQTLESTELDPSQRSAYFFPTPAPSWRVARDRQPISPRLRCLGIDRGKKKKTSCELPDSFMSAHPFGLMLAVAMEFQNTSLRVYGIDPLPYVGGTAGLRFLDGSVRRSAPLLYGLSVIDRMKREADAAAAGRVARELHDGIIQSLSAINLQLEDLRRQASSFLPESYDPLARVQQSVQREIGEMRHLTERLHSFEVDSECLLNYLADIAFKFECECGIRAKFVSEVDEVQLHPRVCGELARIAQEALVNVRKHAKATEVLIRLSRRDGALVLGVIDNGRGFGFSGRRSHQQLQLSGQGPVVIMERSLEINGEVSIESSAGHGSCLEITFPHGIVVA